ncbi:hypothetical protein Goklo_024993 [Gossypium klotzschianum]|uniref:DUF4283 domain-containing protein n=1 Tax=Gossypium klotzschianum TaxID=34286 RepID=A0A7J8WEW3_9ROSI|nr:hypothetical protein [Gossypium klotzschianum]
MLIGEGNTDRREVNRGAGSGSSDEIELMERDVKKSISNGILTIEFSNHIQQILFKEMKTTIVLKLPGQNIGYAALYNRISSLWRLSKPFHLMDIENGYFLAKFHCIGGLVGKVAKLDFNTDSKTRGGFARMTVFVDLDRPLVSQVLVNEELQRVEYLCLQYVFPMKNMATRRRCAHHQR